MASDPAIEAYLDRLDRALEPMPASGRAEIVSEIKSHLLDAKRKSPRRSMQSILDSFGDPRQVAERYLTERGLNSEDPNRSPKDWVLTAVLSYYLGIFGADRFYMGRIGLGILKLITFGGLGLWWLIDTILLALGRMRDADGKCVQPEREKKWGVRLLLAIFLGFAGADRAYLGQGVLAVLKLLSGGGFGIWWFIDILLALSADRKNARETHESSVVKWVFGGLAFVALIFFICLGALIWHFSPLIQINNERVRLFNGAIDINGETGETKVGDSVVGGGEARSFEGSQTIGSGALDSVSLHFVNGQAKVSPSPDSKIHWKFEVKGGENSSASLSGREFKVDLSETGSAKGELQVPGKVKIRVEGVNGDLTVERPKAAVEISMVNGNVTLVPDKNLKYRYDANTVHGALTNLESSASRDAIEVKISLVNGNIVAEKSGN